jgi:hypothetical protein
MRVRHWRGCAVARIGHGAPATRATQPRAGGEAVSAQPVHGADVDRHGHAAPAAVLTHRTLRRHRS